VLDYSSDHLRIRYRDDELPCTKLHYQKLYTLFKLNTPSEPSIVFTRASMYSFAVMPLFLERKEMKDVHFTPPLLPMSFGF